jgi:O-methyltransferase domain
MKAQTAPSPIPAQLLRAREGLLMHQALAAVAKLGVADSLENGVQQTGDLARGLKVNEGALYRIMRLLASQGIFEEASSRIFKNNEVSHFLRTDVPGSVRPLFIFWGSDFYYPCFGEMLYSIETGEPSRTKLAGMNGFEYLRQKPELARIFDDAMTTGSQLSGPAIAAAYDFGAWQSLMDVGGGNGILLSHILRAHPGLRGVLADQEHVLERARQRGFLGSELEARTAMKACDFFQEIPSGCRAYLMKSVIHDWDDEQARSILVNCRKAIPRDGALLLVEFALSGENQPSLGKFVDVIMLIVTGGRERTVDEYRELLASAGFRLNKVVPTPAEFAIIEAFPA